MTTTDGRAREVIALAAALTGPIFGSREDDDGKAMPEKKFDDLSPDWQVRVIEIAAQSLGRFLAFGFKVIDTSTHVAVPREPSEEMVERFMRALHRLDPNRHAAMVAFTEGDYEGIARAAIAALQESRP